MSEAVNEAPGYAEQVAPYPKTVEEVTAEGLAKYLVAEVVGRASRAECMPLGEPDSVDNAVYVANLIGLGSAWSSAFLLRQLRAVDVSAADEAARELFRLWHDGEPMVESAWVWATGYGIDPERVFQETEAFKNRSAESGEVSTQ